MTGSKPTEQPRFSLPAGRLGLAWLVLLGLGLLGWLVIAPRQGMPLEEARAALLGTLVALLVGGGTLLMVSPWKARPSGDLPTLWLLVTVVRLFATPACALLLYFAARQPTGPYVLGIGSAYIALLVLETSVIVPDMRRQIDSN